MTSNEQHSGEKDRPSYEEVMAAIDAVVSAVHSDSEHEDALYERMTEVVRSAVTPPAGTPFAHDDNGNLIAVRCERCGTVVAVSHDHECVTPPT